MPSSALGVAHICSVLPTSAPRKGPFPSYVPADWLPAWGFHSGSTGLTPRGRSAADCAYCNALSQCVLDAFSSFPMTSVFYNAHNALYLPLLPLHTQTNTTSHICTRTGGTPTHTPPASARVSAGTCGRCSCDSACCAASIPFVCLCVCLSSAAGGHARAAAGLGVGRRPGRGRALLLEPSHRGDDVG